VKKKKEERRMKETDKIDLQASCLTGSDDDDDDD